MQTALKTDLLTVEEYLAGEPRSDIRHEYVGGLVYAMAGETKQHNLIVQNLLLAIRPHLRGGPCQSFIEDVKVGLNIADQEIFYYPDLMVACDARDQDPRFVRFPRLIIEVLSDSTEKLDRREKLLAYRTIETLEEYVLVNQYQKEVSVFRRGEKWNPEIMDSADHEVELKSIDLRISLNSIYDEVF